MVQIGAQGHQAGSETVAVDLGEDRKDGLEVWRGRVRADPADCDDLAGLMVSDRLAGRVDAAGDDFHSAAVLGRLFGEERVPGDHQTSFAHAFQGAARLLLGPLKTAVDRCG